jgi:hypothetical protein
MATVHFRGRVLPDSAKVTIKDHPEVNWHDDEENLDIKFTISVEDGKIDIRCDLPIFDRATHLVRVYMRAFDLVRASVDAAAFATGYGLSVIIDTFVDQNGVSSVFISHDPALAALCTAFMLDPASTLEANQFHKVLLIVLGDWRIFRALRELIEAITLPHESAVNCARAIEGLRHILETTGMSRPQSWQNMRDILKLSEPYLKLITDVSTAPRHGDPVRIPGSTTTEITKRAWTIMNRFLEYKKRDAGPLPVSEFPIL